jgi:hypothetical protein
LGGEKEEKMNKKKVFVIAVLLVALISMSSIVYASQEADDNVKSDLTAAQSGNETQQEEAEEKVRYMFVQSAHSGSFVPVEGELNYTLTLEGVSPQTIAFSDRPERDVGQVSMQKFLDGFGFSPENPPNAAIEIIEGNESEDVIVMELFDPIYDAANHTLQYNVSVLEMPNHSYAIFNERHDTSLPENFGPAALFIDDCPDCCYNCCDSNGDYCGCFRVGCCWEWLRLCSPCSSHSCKDRFGDKCAHSCDN